MNDIFDVLETCLQELENGADLNAILARYPDLASELRPVLKASVMARARSADVTDPSPEAIRRGRAKVLQQAAQMREAKVAPRSSKRMIPIFQRLAIAFTLTALFLSSGTGLVSASSSALPGENLYPVKLTWENLRLFFTFDEEYRETLEHAFENERLHEINELLVEGRDETIRFAGVYMEVNSVSYVSGIHIVVLDTSILPVEPLSNGVAVEVTGHTNTDGFVDVESIKLLPAGTAVPTGEPVEVDDTGHDDNDNDSQKEINGNDLNDNSNFNSNDSNGDIIDDTNGIRDNENSNGESVDNGNDDNGNNNDGNNSGSGSRDSGSEDDNSGSGGGDDDGGDDNSGGDDGGGDD